MEIPGSRAASRSALYMALTQNREEEKALKEQMLNQGIQVAAVDYGGEFIVSVTKVIERSVVAAKGGLITTHMLKKAR